MRCHVAACMHVPGGAAGNLQTLWLQGHALAAMAALRAPCAASATARCSPSSSLRRFGHCASVP
jgi:hypothetical protein